LGPNGEMAGWLAAYSCRGSPGLAPEFPFDPLAGNLSQPGKYRAVMPFASAICLQADLPWPIRGAVTGARKGLIGKSGQRSLRCICGTAPATVTGERIATMPLNGHTLFEKAAKGAAIRKVRKPARYRRSFARAG